jgi:hypothetical protein
LGYFLFIISVVFSPSFSSAAEKQEPRQGSPGLPTKQQDRAARKAIGDKLEKLFLELAILKTEIADAGVATEADKRKLAKLKAVEAKLRGELAAFEKAASERDKIRANRLRCESSSKAIDAYLKDTVSLIKGVDGNRRIGEEELQKRLQTLFTMITGAAHDMDSFQAREAKSGRHSELGEVSDEWRRAAEWSGVRVTGIYSQLLSAVGTAEGETAAAPSGEGAAVLSSCLKALLYTSPQVPKPSQVVLPRTSHHAKLLLSNYCSYTPILFKQGLRGESRQGKMTVEVLRCLNELNQQHFVALYERSKTVGWVYPRKARYCGPLNLDAYKLALMESGVGLASRAQGDPKTLDGDGGASEIPALRSMLSLKSSFLQEMGDERKIRYALQLAEKKSPFPIPYVLALLRTGKLEQKHISLLRALCLLHGYDESGLQVKWEDELKKSLSKYGSKAGVQADLRGLLK